MNAKADDEWTPLHSAALKGHQEIAELLIAKGADVNAKDGGGETPLDQAIKYNHTETIDLLRKHGGKTGVELSIQKAVKAGDVEVVKQHLSAGTDVNAKNDRGWTHPLHSAARHGITRKSLNC